MKKNHTKIVFILDRSGSMSRLTKECVGGYNQFVEDQKKVEGTAELSLISFDTVFENVFENEDIQSASILKEDQVYARGMTALLDAVGKSISDTGILLNNLDESERPEHVIFVIMTDGYENSSHEYTSSKIKEMIEHQQSKYNWKFLYMGANQDSFTEGQKLGIDKKTIMDWNPTPDEIVRKVYGASSTYTTTMRECGVVANTLSDIGDEEMKKK